MVELVIEEGAPRLKTYWEDGDWMLLVTNQHASDEANFSPKDKKQLKKLDRGIADVFPPALLKEYAFLE